MARKISGFVYFILAENGYCKIGKATNPENRLRGLQARTSLKLELFHQVASNDVFWLETKLHRYFDHARVKGEWFSLDNEELVEMLSLQRLDNFSVRGRGFDDPLPHLKPSTAGMSHWGKIGGSRGGPARAAKLSAERRSEIARMGALAKKAKMMGNSTKPPPR